LKGGKMALINCPSCGTEVSKEAVSCPKCGHPFKKTAQGMSGCGLFFVIVGAIIVAAILMSLGL
jgi:predicted nucleic acid-binding Zn ribbon protein